MNTMIYRQAYCHENGVEFNPDMDLLELVVEGSSSASETISDHKSPLSKIDDEWELDMSDMH